MLIPATWDWPRPLGAEVPNPEDVSFNLPTGEAVEGIPADQPLVALHPFSRGQGKSLTSLEVSEFLSGGRGNRFRGKSFIAGIPSLAGRTTCRPIQST